MWDQTVCILQKAYDLMEDADKEALKKLGREELAGLRASCSETPWLAGAMMVMRSNVKAIPKSLFAVRPVAKTGGEGLGEFELMVHPAFFLLAWSARKHLNEVLNKFPEKEIEIWEKELQEESGATASTSEQFYTHGWLAGVCHEIGHILHNPWMRSRPIQRTAYAVLSKRFPEANRGVRMEMAKLVREITSEGMAETRRAELEAWIRNSKNAGRKNIEPTDVLKETPLLFAMRQEEDQGGKKSTVNLPAPEELAIFGVKDSWSDLRMAEYVAQRITSKMMDKAEKESDFIRKMMKMIGLTGNEEGGKTHKRERKKPGRGRRVEKNTRSKFNRPSKRWSISRRPSDRQS